MFMAWTLFIGALLMLGAWFLMRAYVPFDIMDNPYLVLGLRGIQGAFMGAFVSTVVAVVVCYNPFFAPPQTADTIGTVSWEDSRLYMSYALILGFNMIGVPIGFLIAVARANKALNALVDNDRGKKI